VKITRPAELFRREALEFWSRQRGPGPVLRATTAWVRWLYWIVLTLVMAGAALTFFARIDQSISGPVLVNAEKRTFVAVLPTVANAHLQSGRPVHLQMDGPYGWRDVAVRTLHTKPASETDIHQAGFGSFPQPAILLSGALTSDAADLARTQSSRLTGRAVIMLGSKPMISMFLHGFDGAPDRGNG
jgi:hypothetical protein